MLHISGPLKIKLEEFVLQVCSLKFFEANQSKLVVGSIQYEQILYSLITVTVTD